jgi:hypothetical protein
MGDDDLIRRGDALKIALAYASGEGAALAEHAIRAIPAADAVADALREAAEMIDKRHRGDLPDHIKSEDGNAIRAMIKEDAPRRYMGQIVAECDCSRRQECEAAQKCLADAAQALYDTLKKARVGEAYMSDADDGLDCVTLDGIFNLEAIK